MKTYFKRLVAEEDAAVTVDWVVLTAAIIGLGVMAIGILAESLRPNAANLKNRLTDHTIGVNL